MIAPRYARIAKNMAFLVGLQGVQRVLGLVTTYFMVRAITQSAYGEYNFALAFLDVVSILALPGIDNAVMQSAARGYRGSYRAAVRPALLCSLAGSALLVGVGVWYGSDNRALAACFLASAPLFPLAYGLTQWKGVRQGTEDFAGIAKLEGITSVATSVVVIAIVVASRPTVALLAVVILLGRAVLNVVMTIHSFRRIRRDEPVEPGIVRYGVKTSGYLVLGVIARHIDKFLLFAFLTPAAVGIYAAAERIPELVKAQIKNLADVLGPRFARHPHYSKQVDRAFNWFSVVVGVLSVALAFTLLPWALRVIFGDAYRESIPYAQALMCSLAIAGSAPVRFRFISSRPDTASFREVNTLMAAFRIVASLCLVPFFGLLGAVASAFLARIGYLVAINVVMKKRYPMYDDVTPFEPERKY